MLNYDMTEIFDALKDLASMNDEEFEKLKVEFDNIGCSLKRVKHGNDDVDITITKL